MPASRSNAASSGQIASCRRWYSATWPGLSFMRKAWFIAASVRRWRGMRRIEMPGIVGNVPGQTRQQPGIGGAQALDDHARQRVRAVFIMVRLVAPFIGKGVRGEPGAECFVEATAHVVKIDERDAFFAGDVPYRLWVVAMAVHD